MFVFVKLYGQQRLHANADRIEIPVATVKSVSDVYKYLKRFYPGLAISKESLLITVNDRVSRMEEAIKENDTVRFMPVMGGG